ncbi:metal ABC transporter substrate-binding protein [Acrocarpospora catenulata]|uniref:metal ABC transporter substrate-binding protein n=1 Tax=Acrocarpospora catenulata TaxID=2836182 RepID=UPI001BDA92D7|nr:metal ABC transporter substrate-binding protein [Acrocarpospora catenulata]
MSRLCALAASMALLSVSACGGPSTADSTDNGTFAVAASFYPLQWLAEQVGGPDTTVEGLTKPGVEPHDLELTPRQVADVADAGLVVYIKGVQPAVDEAVTQHAADRSFDAATAVPTLAAEEHGEEEHADEHGHAELPYDPHLWLDPSRFATVATKLGERLAAADPAHAAAYRDRATAIAAELTTLDKEFQQGLATCQSRVIVTSHEAFGYLADRYRLQQIGVSGLDPDAEPTPARLAQVADVAKREKVTTIFTEELVSPKVSEVLAQEVGAKTAVLNPLESQPAGGDYLTAMRTDLTTLRGALGCT